MTSKIIVQIFNAGHFTERYHDSLSAAQMFVGAALLMADNPGIYRFIIVDDFARYTIQEVKLAVDITGKKTCIIHNVKELENEQDSN